MVTNSWNMYHINSDSEHSFFFIFPTHYSGRIHYAGEIISESKGKEKKRNSYPFSSLSAVMLSPLSRATGLVRVHSGSRNQGKTSCTCARHTLLTKKNLDCRTTSTLPSSRGCWRSSILPNHDSKTCRLNNFFPTLLVFWTKCFLANCNSLCRCLRTVLARAAFTYKKT